MVEQVGGSEGGLSIDKKCIWLDKNGEGGVVEVEVHWVVRKAVGKVELGVVGVVEEHVERVGRIQRKVGCRVVGAVCFGGAHRRRR